VTSSRRSTPRRVAPVVAVLIALALLCPLPGPTLMKCTYDGDSGSCETLFYRSGLTIGLATLRWGRDVVNERP
jgi:hypothetical protein